MVLSLARNLKYWQRIALPWLVPCYTYVKTVWNETVLYDTPKHRFSRGLSGLEPKILDDIWDFFFSLFFLFLFFFLEKIIRRTDLKLCETVYLRFATGWEYFRVKRKVSAKEGTRTIFISRKSGYSPNEKKYEMWNIEKVTARWSKRLTSSIFIS